MEKTQVMVNFSPYGDSFPLEHVTESLGINPTQTYKMGDLIVRPYNPNVITTKPIYRKETVWDLSTGYQESWDVKNQMDQILEPLKDKAPIINQLKAEYNLECKLFIVIIVENGKTPAFYLNNEQIEFANSIKAEFDIDLYANPFESVFTTK
ncbi:DUF4279 domain-containing protein [Bacillus sp. B-jedd]|uniref:DUF4279 domain-containing protein n=1 Tax=Bacillus sp. B-jedd TaxID=1476857 RepID=UPI0005155913|nr:DUF4279 domain-containing protein [Bacillus sp. B-jedd]CEG27160.1 Hypothetical protein BN1002_02016 [Bacillus sp. B-jedd]